MWILRAGHPMVGQPCAACGVEFVAGDDTTIGCPMPASPEDERLAAEGRPHTVGGQLVHELCDA